VAEPALYAIGLGSNRRGRAGDPRAVVRAALAELPGLVAASRVIDSAPLGPSSRRFANAVALVRAPLDPPALLGKLKAIERRYGRRRGRRWGARVLDLDILLWERGCWRSRGLVVPHAAWRTRGFVLAPLTEIAPDWRDPVTGLRVRHLRARLTRATPAPRSHVACVGP